MAAIRAGLIALSILGVAASTALANSSSSASSWRWTSWTPETGVTPLRFSAAPRSDSPAFVLRDQTPNTSALLTAVPLPDRPLLAPSATNWRIVPSGPPSIPAPVPSPIAQPVSYQAPTISWTLRPEALQPVERSFAVDAFINTGGGPYAQEYPLTAGNAQPWYDSAVASKVYGGTPSLEQRQEFSRDILQRVEATFARSGLNVTLTDQSNVTAAHTLSVVSGTQSPASPSAVGITDIGRSGFTFIDKLSYANSVDELKTAIANNVAHELMHAFGVDRHDPTGSYIDSAVADWSTMINPNATFSQTAIGELLAKDFSKTDTNQSSAAQQVHGPNCTCPMCRGLQLVAAPVPEPSTCVVWIGCVGAVGLFIRRRGQLAKNCLVA